MQSRQGSTHQSLRDTSRFIIDHADQLGDIPNTGAAQKLRASLEELDKHDNQQRSRGIFAQSSSRQSHAFRKVLLRHHMVPIARIAAVELPHTQELRPLRMPASTATFSAVVSAAHGMATVAKAYEHIFVESGLAADFIARLASAAGALQASLDDRGRNRNLRAGATVGLRTTIRAARQAVNVLDGLVRVALDDDPALLTTWNAARSVRHSGTKASAAPAAGTPAVAPITPAPVVTAAA